MRPAVAAFSVLALGALALLGSLLYRLVGDEPVAEPEISDTELASADAGRALSLPTAQAAPAPAWVAKAKKSGRAAPRFDPGVFERVRAVETLRQQSKQDGFLFRQAGSDEVFVVQKGTRFKVSGPDELKSLGFRTDQIIEVAPGTMDHLTERPPDRALLRQNGDPRIFYFEDGVKRWVSDPGAFNRHGFDWGAVRVTPTGSLNAYGTGEPLR